MIVFSPIQASYSSPLATLGFRGYRSSPHYSRLFPSLSCLTLSNKVDSHVAFCRYDLEGQVSVLRSPPSHRCTHMRTHRTQSHPSPIVGITVFKHQLSKKLCLNADVRSSMRADFTPPFHGSHNLSTPFVILVQRRRMPLAALAVDRLVVQGVASGHGSI